MDEACPKCGEDDGIAGKCAAMFVAKNAEIASLRAELATAVQHGADQWRAKDLAQLDADRLRAELTANNELYSITQSDLAAASLQYDAATTVIERLEAEIADRDRVIEGLNKPLSEQFELSTKYVGLWDKQCAAARHDAEAIARLGAELAQTTSALHSYSDALTQLIGWAEDGSPEDGYLYAVTEAKKVLKDFKVVGSEVERLRAALAAAKRELNDAEEARNDAETRLLAGLAAARQDADEIARLKDALEPFANAYDKAERNGYFEHLQVILRNGSEWLGHAGFQAADLHRAALACRPQPEAHTPAHGPFPGAPFSPPKGDK